MYNFAENKLNWHWQIDDGRIWSTQNAAFVDKGAVKEWLNKSGFDEIPTGPFDEQGQSSLEGLIAALEFYGLPKGALAPPEEAALAEYITATTESAAIFTARVQRQFVQAEDFTATEYATFAKAGLFPEWTHGAEYVKGNRIMHEGVVYEVQQPVTAQEHQPPGSTGMFAVYRPISVDSETGDEPDGSREKPYAFLSGMDVYTGKYYTFEGKLYLAKADMIPCVWAPGTAGLWQWELVE